MNVKETEGCRYCGIPRAQSRYELCREDEKRFGLKVHPSINALARHDFQKIDENVWENRIATKIQEES